MQASFAQVAPIAATAADLFYGRLFEITPSLRPMFPDDLAEQKKKLMAMLGTVVASLDRLDSLLPAVRALGRRHAGYGVTEEQYDDGRSRVVRGRHQAAREVHPS